MLQEDVITIIVTCFLVSFMVILGAVVLLIFVQNERRRKQQEIFHAVLEAQTQEQKRVGQDLHDEVGPMLAGISNQLELYKADAPSSTEREARLERMLQHIQYTSTAIRNASHELIPVDFNRMTLAEALVDNLLPLNSTKFKVQLTKLAPRTKLEAKQKAQVLKIAKELVINAKKHSEGNRVEVGLFQNDHTTTLTVTDNGKGFSFENNQNNKGVGLRNISSRLKFIKGTITTSHVSTGGLHVEITVKN